MSTAVGNESNALIAAPKQPQILTRNRHPSRLSPHTSPLPPRQPMNTLPPRQPMNPLPPRPAATRSAAGAGVTSVGAAPAVRGAIREVWSDQVYQGSRHSYDLRQIDGRALLGGVERERPPRVYRVGQINPVRVHQRAEEGQVGIRGWIRPSGQQLSHDPLVPMGAWGEGCKGQAHIYGGEKPQLQEKQA